MTLINIEYGSLASSNTMNQNFTYLDDKIDETSDSINTSISSILSNIATINSRLNEMSEEFEDSVAQLNTTIDDYKSKTKLLVKKTNMVPDWASCSSVSIIVNEQYEAPSNGYLLLIPNSSEQLNLTIDGVKFLLNHSISSEENSSQLLVIPVLKNDLINSNLSVTNAYFLPTKEISLEDF